MPELYRGFGAGGMNGIGDVAERFHNLPAHPQLARKREPVACHGSVSERGHAHSALGDRHMIIFQLLRRTVAGTHTLKRRRADSAVAQRNRTDIDRREQFGVFVHNSQYI